MNDIRLVLLFFLICFFCNTACKKQQENDRISLDSSGAKIELMSLDTILLDGSLTSQVGYFFISDLGVHFADRVQSKLFTFSLEGEYLGTSLEKGDGPKNQNGLQGLVFKDSLFYVLSDKFISIFDRDFTIKERFQFKWGGHEPFEEMLNFPTADMFGLYEIAWISRLVNMPFIPLEKEGGFILPVMMTHPKLNGYWTTDYYEEVSNLGLFNKNLELIKLGGKRSKEYLDHHFLPNFDFTNLVRRRGELLVSFPIDYKIYVYDLNLEYLRKFGDPGKMMKQDYISTQTLEEAEAQWELDFDQFGFYDHLFYDEEKDLLFRSYVPQGRQENFSRLQIYREERLVADVKVPLRFKVIGSSGKFYYADGIIDEENEKLGFYKFSIDEM